MMLPLLIFFLITVFCLFLRKKICLLELDCIIGLKVQLSDQKIESF